MGTPHNNQAVEPRNLALLDASKRDDIGRHLQQTLVELVGLALLGKQLHWSVTGPHFRSLHLQLDEMIDSWRELGDAVAERSVAIGFMPDGQVRTVSRDSDIAVLERGVIEDHLVVRTLTRQLAETVERIRPRMDKLSQLDSPSEDVLVTVVRALEEQLWMIRVQLSS